MSVTNTGVTKTVIDTVSTTKTTNSKWESNALGTSIKHAAQNTATAEVSAVNIAPGSVMLDSENASANKLAKVHLSTSEVKVRFDDEDLGVYAETVTNENSILSTVTDGTDTTVVEVLPKQLNLTGTVFITPENYGATADGITDVTDALLEAINSDYKVIVIGKRITDVYRTSMVKVVPDDKVIVVNGTLVPIDSEIKPITANVLVGDTVISVADADQFFKVGQQVCLSDDSQPFERALPLFPDEQRRYGYAFTVVAVNSTSVTLDSAMTLELSIASNAKIGHVQSVFLIEGNNCTITGSGVIDVNRDNQYNVYPVLPDVSEEAIYFGCGISSMGVEGLNVNGITLKNSVLHNISVRGCNNPIISNLRSFFAYDKSILLWECDDFNLSNLAIYSSLHEDGITIYKNTNGGNINNVTINDCNRGGILCANVGVKNINISNIVTKDCASGLDLDSADSVNIRNFTIIGGGTTRFTTSVQPAATIEECTYCDVELTIRDYNRPTRAVEVSGIATGCKIKSNVFSTSVPANVTGIGFIVRSGFYPTNIDFTGHFEGCAVAVNVATGCSKIVANEVTFLNNTADVIDPSNVLQTTSSYAGSTIGAQTAFDALTITQEKATDSATIYQNGFNGQVGTKWSRATGTKAAPTALASGSGIGRISVRGYTGAAFSAFYPFFQAVTTEAWTATANGFKARIQTRKAGTVALGLDFDFTENGLGIGVGSDKTTGRLQIAAGTATAGTAPIKLTSGVVNTTPENGAIEYDGTDYFVTSGGARYVVVKSITGVTSNLNFPSTLPNTESELTVAYPGAVVGDKLSKGFPPFPSGANYTAWVSSANTITVRLTVTGVSAVDPAAADFKFSITK